MNKINNLFPNFRFNDSKDKWKSKQLGDLVEINRGLTYKPSDVTTNGVRVLRSSNINGTSFEISDLDVFVNEQAVNINYIENNNILITAANGSSNLVGKHAIVKGIVENTVHGGFMLSLRTEYPNFIQAWMNSSEYLKILNLVQGGNGSIGNLSKKILEEAKISLPESISEIIEIGSLFKTLDDLLMSYKDNLANYQTFKGSMLSKMFPKAGQKEPEIRLEGFNDEWDNFKIKDISVINPKSSIPDEFKYVDLESVSGVNLLNYYLVNKETAPSRAQRVASNNDIFFQTVRPYQKNNYLFKFEEKDWVFSTGYAQIRPKINSEFLFISLQRNDFVSSVLLNCTGTSYPSINSKDLSNLTIKVPKNLEQIAIGQFFSNLDDTIASIHNKITALKDLKKKLLKEMFL
ncbi:restriction endonuclease subunit S [Streptococcus penaeicida]|uniref:Restriction endonuclease subunit S n=1 Tax=Streptococcus penaeicida TaxID=1765960 RepID=A0A2N8LCP0_9STRE|nr:restriction endonuclease subunit S [Streptococcus penaeicida]PND47933.1 restriction endonuclease subunit S [Streptococcus penaeicida]